MTPNTDQQDASAKTVANGLPVPGDTCWRIAQADQAAVIIDAADYFRHARAAMLKAERRIMLIGWDFDSRIALEREPGDDGPEHVGEFITWLVERNPDLHVYLLRWDIGALKAVFHLRTFFMLFKWWRLGRIHARLDHYHPTGASHHQKILVIDDDLALAGGIDMTANRWDTRAHLDEDPGRRHANGSYAQPWHDAAWAVDGDAARALGDLCRMRWHFSGAAPLLSVAEVVSAQASGEAASPTESASCWPAALAPNFRSVNIAVARTLPEMPNEPATLEIERLYLAQIAATRTHLYIESQYFASRTIAAAILDRLNDPDGPEIVIINPVVANGWLQQLAMDTAREQLLALLKSHDPKGRLRVYHPMTAAGKEIYVHAKILIGDARFLRIGSSNMNNRSMRLDTECDLAMDTQLPDDSGCSPGILAVRDGLIAEHLGVAVDVVTASIAATGSLIATIEALRKPVGQGQKTLMPYALPDIGSAKKWLGDSELLDPEGPSEMFEPLSKRGLMRGLIHRRSARKGQKQHDRALAGARQCANPGEPPLP